MIHYPYEVTVIFCDILPKIKTTDKSLSAVVIAAFQMLCWFKTTYTYDDCLEQYQDWSEEQLNDNGMENEEIEAIKSELLWIEHNIPEDYHFLLRNKERPEFPLFPECPPASEWTHPWWQWAKEVFDKSLSWKEPIPYFPHHDLLPETCVLDPGYFTPFLWAPSDPLSGYFSEMLDSEYQGGSEPFGILPFNNTIEIREAVHLLKRSSECFDLVLKASHLPDPPEQDRKEETPS